MISPELRLKASRIRKHRIKLAIPIWTGGSRSHALCNTFHACVRKYPEMPKVKRKRNMSYHGMWSLDVFLVIGQKIYIIEVKGPIGHRDRRWETPKTPGGAN